MLDNAFQGSVAFDGYDDPPINIDPDSVSFLVSADRTERILSRLKGLVREERERLRTAPGERPAVDLPFIEAKASLAVQLSSIERTLDTFAARVS